MFLSIWVLRGLSHLEHLRARCESFQRVNMVPFCSISYVKYNTARVWQQTDIPMWSLWSVSMCVVSLTSVKTYTLRSKSMSNPIIWVSQSKDSSIRWNNVFSCKPSECVSSYSENMKMKIQILLAKWDHVCKMEPFYLVCTTSKYNLRIKM